MSCVQQWRIPRVGCSDSIYSQLLFQIPDRDVGLCIGRQGCVIREMQQKTQTRIQIPSQPTPGQPHRVTTISGSQEGCAQAQALIEQISVDQSSACVMSGTPHQNQYQQQQQQQYVDQSGGNHSAEWQAYYAAQAVAQQQAAPQPAPAPAPAAAAPAAGADAYYEQFFRYAYYYGEPSARQYYGAWSPPPGTPNPYGVNPAGITPAPAGAPSHNGAAAHTPAAAAPAPYAAAPAPAYRAPAPAPQAPQGGGARDSSRRKVSNLPAWMTRGT